MPISFPSTSVNNNVSFFLDFVGMLPRDRATVYRENILKFRDKTDNTVVSIANTGGGTLQVLQDELYTGNSPGGYLSTTFNSELVLGTNPYTIEMIVMLPTARTAAIAGLLSVNVAADATSWQLGVDNLNRATFQNGTNTTQTSVSTLPVDQRRHIAIVRNSTAANDTRIYLNGVLERTFTDAVNYSYAQGLLIGTGRGAANPALQTYIRAMRVTNGTAQYSGASFTPPTSLPYVAIGDTYKYLDKIYKWSGVKWYDRSKYNANIPGEFRNYLKVTANTAATPLDLRSSNFFEIDLVAGVDTSVSFQNEASMQSFATRVDQATTNNIVYWSINSASYTGVNVLATIPADTNPYFSYFKPDGLKLYIYGGNTGVVYEWNLSTAWSITTAVYSGSSFSTLAQDNQVYGMFFKSDGAKMYIVGAQNSSVREYNLSTPWSVSTASLAATFSVSGQLQYAGDMFFKPDGTKLYIPNASTNVIFEYNLSTPWTVSTASYSGTSLSVLSQGTPQSLSFSPDGTRMHTVVAGASAKVFQYNLTTPWLISSATYNSVNFSISSQATTFGSIRFKTEGDKMYILSRTNAAGRIYEYNSTTGGIVSVNQTITWPSNIAWSTGSAPSIIGATLMEFYKYNGTWHGNVIAANT
jgi:hypothetical protein